MFCHWFIVTLYAAAIGCLLVMGTYAVMLMAAVVLGAY